MCPLEALYMECEGSETHGGRECSALSIRFNCNSGKYTRCSPTLQYFFIAVLRQRGEKVTILTSQEV